MQPWSTETGAERESSRPLLREPEQLAGDMHPYLARPGQPEVLMSAPQLFVGVDVAKAQLDMALRSTGERWAVAHDDTGIATLVARLQAVQPTLMGLEATGGSQRAVVAALAATGLPVVVVHSLPSA